MEALNQLKNILKSITPISEHDLEESLASFQPQALKKGDFFVKSGDMCAKAAFLNSGIIRTYYVNEKGDDVTYCFCDTHRFTTSFKSFISRNPSALSMQALEDCELMTITYDALQGLYNQYPAWQAIGRILVEREFVVMEQYASSLSTETAKEKYLRLMKEQPAIIQRAPVQYIASYLGISRETLSRIRNQVAHSIL